MIFYQHLKCDTIQSVNYRDSWKFLELENI